MREKEAKTLMPSQDDSNEGFGLNDPDLQSVEIRQTDFRPKTVASMTGLSSKQRTTRDPSSIIGGGKLDIDKVTPEQAAIIVKRFILPMFENSKRPGKISNQTGSVQQELMLSDQLKDQIATVKNELDDLMEKLEVESNAKN